MSNSFSCKDVKLDQHPTLILDNAMDSEKSDATLEAICESHKSMLNTYVKQTDLDTYVKQTDLNKYLESEDIIKYVPDILDELAPSFSKYTKTEDLHNGWHLPFPVHQNVRLTH